MSAGDNVPSTSARLHRVVDRGAALADDVTLGIFHRQQRLIERIGDRGGDRGDAGLAETATILQHVAADQLESVRVVALGLGVELGEAPIGSILAE